MTQQMPNLQSQQEKRASILYGPEPLLIQVALLDALGQWIYLNGSASRKLYWQTPANSTVSVAQTFISVMDLSAADYLEWYIYVQFSSGTISVDVGPSYNEWGVFKLAGV